MGGSSDFGYRGVDDLFAMLLKHFPLSLARRGLSHPRSARSNVRARMCALEQNQDIDYSFALT